MIITEELVICKRRGHATKGAAYGWARCKWCGMWIREVTVVTIEECEDEPPDKQKSVIAHLPKS
jgi:hypothetical protein